MTMSTILPEARPMNETYYANSGLVPQNYGSVYLYSGSYEMDKTYYVFDSVYDHSGSDEYKLTRMDGFTNYEYVDEQDYFLAEYYEDAKSFSVSFDMPYIGGQLKLNYPIKTNSFNSRTYYDYDRGATRF